MYFELIFSVWPRGGEPESVTNFSTIKKLAFRKIKAKVRGGSGIYNQLLAYYLAHSFGEKFRLGQGGLFLQFNVT